MSTDFFNDDLLKNNSIKDEGERVDLSYDREYGANRMVRQKEELSNQVAGAVSEIERLKMRQDKLEKEKSNLEELSQKQDEYERGKQDIIEKLNSGMVVVEKEETQAIRMVELLSETRTRFSNMLAELNDIDEEAWSDDNFQVELNRALIKVDISRNDYKKALARIEATSWHKNVMGGKLKAGSLESITRDLIKEKSFRFWLKVGLAMSLPIMLFLVALFVAWLVSQGVI